METSNSSTIVFYPSPERSHLVPMIELGKLILKYHPHFAITVIIATPTFETGSTGTYIAAVSATTPSVTVHHLPPVPLPNNDNTRHSHPSNIKVQTFECARLNNDNLRRALCNLSASSNLKAFVTDFFCHAAAEVSSSFNLPTYYFHTGGARGLAALLYFPTLHENNVKSLKDLDALIDIPGLSPLPSKDMPTPMLDRTSKIYSCFLEAAILMRKSAGVIVNTVEGLEEKALNAIKEGECTPNMPPPHVFCIGPLFVTDETTTNNKQKDHDHDHDNDKHECLSWLDSQPSRSVLFLTFGSLGKFSTKQLREMAIGLERSGLRFLWVVRYPPSDDETMRKLLTTDPEPGLDSLLPEGFLERTKNRGLVVKGWAPQVDVLNHDSVGGFLTHCGWNSALESVVAGVPMLGWPLYSEQKLYRIALVEELKVALALGMSASDGFVTADELEKHARELMESEKGAKLREQVEVVKEVVVDARNDRGSSRIGLAKFVQSFNQG